MNEARLLPRLQTPALRPPRSSSRYSNLSESYVYPNSDIHPLTVRDNNKPRFNTTIKPTPPTPQPSIFQPTTPALSTSPHPHQPQYYDENAVSWCLPPRCTTAAAVHTDPTHNAPLSKALAAASLTRHALESLETHNSAAGVVIRRSRWAVEAEEEEARRREEEVGRVHGARRAAKERVVEGERRKREMADRRMQQLPLHVRQLVYQKWEEAASEDNTSLQTTQLAHVTETSTDNGAVQPPLQPASAANEAHRTMLVDDLDDTALPNRTIAAQRLTGSLAAGLHGGASGWLLMSRDEQRVFQLRVQQLARHKERLELHRVVALKAQEAQQKQKAKQKRKEKQQQAAPLQTTHPQPQQHPTTQHTTTTTTTTTNSRTRPTHHQPNQHRGPNPAQPPSRLAWLYADLQRRLRALGDISLAPLCHCSKGGGIGGVGRGLVHFGGCEWVGRDEAYAMAVGARVGELERVRAEDGLGAEVEQQQGRKEVDRVKVAGARLRAVR